MMDRSPMRAKDGCQAFHGRRRFRSNRSRTGDHGFFRRLYHVLCQRFALRDSFKGVAKVTPHAMSSIEVPYVSVPLHGGRSVQTPCQINDECKRNLRERT